MNKNIDEKKLEPPPYDQIINIDSLKTQKIGWEIFTNKKTANLLKEKREYSIVGMVGRECTGKTYILNKLCGFDLPSGTNVNTKGLSLKLANKKNLICLDSAGLNSPVYYYNETLLKRYNLNQKELFENGEVKKEMMNDRTLTDLFIQDFILDVCEVIIIVVGQLSQQDQKFIERISMKYKHRKKIIIIHNFYNLCEDEDIERKIKKDIIGAFEVTSRNIVDSDVNEYIEKTTKEGHENIIHVVLGLDWGNSKKKYNKPTFKYLSKILDTRNDKKKFDLTSSLIEFFNDNFRLYIRFKGKPSKVQLVKEDNYLQIISDKDYEISNPLFNTLGSLVTNPPYEVNEFKDRYVCFIELSDFDKDSLSYSIDKSTEYNILVLSGMKNETYNKEKIEKFNSTRNTGFVTCKIPLGPRSIEVKIDKKSIKYKDGILIVSINLKLEDEETIIY